MQYAVLIGKELFNVRWSQMVMDKL